MRSLDSEVKGRKEAGGEERYGEGRGQTKETGTGNRKEAETAGKTEPRSIPTPKSKS